MDLCFRNQQKLVSSILFSKIWNFRIGDEYSSPYINIFLLK